MLKQVTNRRVFVRRRSRTTTAQARGLARREEFTLKDDEIEEARSQQRPLFVEIGFGNGAALAQFALAHPDWLCVGVEVFEPGIGALINQCIDNQIPNVRMTHVEGLSFLESLKNDSVDLIWVLFPDPWPKKRHHKRRLITSEFAEVVFHKLREGAHIQIATDWADYAEQIETVFKARRHQFSSEIASREARVTTKYEQRGLRLGHDVTESIYVKRPAQD